MTLLQQLRDQGYFRDASHVRLLLTDADLSALRWRFDYWQLLRSVAPEPPKNR
jgi:hypothetical protein